MRQGVQVCLGSALRLSQPLSGFLARSSFAALFRAATVRDHSSFRDFPSQESRTSFEATGSLAVIRPTVTRKPLESFADRFRSVHEPKLALPLPLPTMDSLFPCRSTRPGPPKLKSPQPSVFAATSPASKRCSSCESVRTDASRPTPAVDPLLGFSPL
jgi:hypothetical protein